MAQWELTSKLGPYLDRHLVIPLLEFLSVNGKDIYDETDLLKGKLELLSGTNMIDFAMDVHKTLYPDQDVPKDLQEKRPKVVAEYSRLQEATKPLADTFADPAFNEVMANRQMEPKQLVEYLGQNTTYFRPEMVDTVYDFAKFCYEIGIYEDASKYLYIHRVLAQPTDKNFLNGLWGKLACEILTQNWESALTELGRLGNFIDQTTFASSLQSLQMRTWLIHWSLFVYFNHPKGRDLIIDKFLYNNLYLNAIQTTCPWVLRYLSTAVIINKAKRSGVMRDLVKVVQQESYTHRDPITSFIEDLYVKFDFDGAQQKLRDCENVLVNDFFLVACLDEFVENSRLMIFETFCRIHQCISIKMLASKLNMTTDEAERWIVNLIRNANLDAKIDSQLGHVVMGTHTVSPYEALIERTKHLSMRSQILQLNVEKKKKAQDQPNWGDNDGF